MAWLLSFRRGALSGGPALRYAEPVPRVWRRAFYGNPREFLRETAAGARPVPVICTSSANAHFSHLHLKCKCLVSATCQLRVKCKAQKPFALEVQAQVSEQRDPGGNRRTLGAGCVGTGLAEVPRWLRVRPIAAFVVITSSRYENKLEI